MTATAVGADGMARRGDTHEFDAFVRARLPHLLIFGRALTGDDHRAADLVQDALEQTYRHWDRIVRDDPEGYVRATMANRNISIWRKLRRERLTDRVPGSANPVTERDQAVWAAIRELAPRQRAVIALRYLEDLTERQTAEILGCSVGTIKSQTSRALAKLRDLLPESEDD